MPKKTTTQSHVIANPFSEAFLPDWELWKQYKAEQFQFKYKSAITEQMALNSLVSLSNGDEVTAVLIIKQSMSQGWKGFFELKKQFNGSATKQTVGAGSQSPVNNTGVRQQINDLYSQSNRKW